MALSLGEWGKIVAACAGRGEGKGRDMLLSMKGKSGGKRICFGDFKSLEVPVTQSGHISRWGEHAGNRDGATPAEVAPAFFFAKSWISP